MSQGAFVKDGYIAIETNANHNTVIMQMINLTQPEADVTMKVTIEGIDLWSYDYSGDTNIKNSAKTNNTKSHPLGLTKNLLQDSDIITIHLANKYNEDRDVLVKVNWYENGKECHEWIPEEAGSNGKVKVKANDGLKIQDSLFYY